MSPPAAPDAPGTIRPGRITPDGYCNGCLATDPSYPPFKPRIPDEYNVKDATYWGLFKICATKEGAVKSVGVVKSTNVPEIDERWKGTIMNWRYHPYLDKGAPVPFCYVLRLQVAATW